MPPVSRRPDEAQLEIDLGINLEQQPGSQLKTLEGVDIQSMPLEDLAQLVAKNREYNTSFHARLNRNHSPDDAGEAKINVRKGGAFGGALKRRIELSDSQSLRTATNDYDIALLRPTNLRAELFPKKRGDLVYGGVLFTPTEYGAITISPAEVGRRIGANVLANTTDRPPTERLQRRTEVVTKDLQRRVLKADLLVSELETERIAISQLQKEMRTPGDSHMTQTDIDGLMTITESVLAKMFDAIIANHKLPTERTDQLTNAMHYSISADDYKATFSYWKLASNLAEVWTSNKKDRLSKVRYNIQQELTQIS